MRYDVAVIGGGLSGSTVAAALVRVAPGAKILLIEKQRFHSRISGCEVCEGSNVIVVRTIEDRIDSLRLEGNLPLRADENGWVSARQFIDASGSAGVIGRLLAGIALGLPCSLQKTGIWGVWKIPHWPQGWPRTMMKRSAVGCLWLIPISEKLVSVGFVAPADLCEDSALTRAELYAEAIAADPQVDELISASQLKGEIRCTSGPAYLPGRTIGDNWTLVGESAGFADPVQAVGMSLAELGVEEAAAVIAAGLRGEANHMVLRHDLADSQSQRLAELVKLENSWCAANYRSTASRARS